MIKKDMRGFTLIESLLVFWVCAMFLLLPTLAIRKWKEVLEVEQFLSSFEKKLLFTQQMSIVNSIDTQVLFFEQSQKLDFLIPKDGHLVAETMEIPSALNAVGPHTLTFKKNSGNNGNLGKFSFSWIEKNQLIEFQFQLGSGRYVKKNKPI